MSSAQVLISVIIPAYNAEAFIQQTLTSVLSQTYSQIEVLVVDDGSSDRTPEIVRSIAEKDDRVVLLQQSNLGVAAARNLAIEKSKGDYIAPIDADDIWYPQKLEKQMECMLKADPSVGLVYTWSVYVDEQGKIIGEYDPHQFTKVHSIQGEVYPALIYRNFIGHASVPLIRRSCFEKVGGYNHRLKEQNAQGCEDWDMYLRVAEHYTFQVVPEFLAGYRQVTGSMSDNSLVMAKSYRLVMSDSRKKHPELPEYIYRWSASYFYSYLLGKSLDSKDYAKALIWLVEAIKNDYLIFLRLGVYKIFTLCSLRILIGSIVTSFQQMNRGLPSLDVKRHKEQSAEMIEISALTKQMSTTKLQVQKPYDIVLAWRWNRTLEACQFSKTA